MMHVQKSAYMQIIYSFKLGGTAEVKAISSYVIEVAFFVQL